MNWLNPALVIQGVTAIGFVLTGLAAMLTYIKTRSTHDLVNSQSQKLLDLTREAEFAKGKLEGLEELVKKRNGVQQ